MSYEPTTWNDGDLVTSAKLNKIEQGIAANGGILFVHVIEDEEYHLDKTWQDIHDADVCYIINRDENETEREIVLATIKQLNHRYVIFTTNPDNIYIATSPDDYPVPEDFGGK